MTDRTKNRIKDLVPIMTIIGMGFGAMTYLFQPTAAADKVEARVVAVEKTVADQEKKLEQINRNVIKLLIHLQIQPE